MAKAAPQLEPTKPKGLGPPTEMNGAERAAVLLLALGEEYGAKIWAQLDDDELRQLGVAMSTLMGKYLAAFVRREAPDVALLDADRFRPVPLYAFREAGVRLVAAWYQFLDSIGQ